MNSREPLAKLLMVLVMLISPGLAYTSQSPVDEARIDLMLSQSDQYRTHGPNCFSSVLYAGGLVDDWALVDAVTIREVFRSSHCQRLESLEDVRPGDFSVIQGNLYGFQHAVLHVSKAEVFAKMGHAKQNHTTISPAKENLSLYMTGLARGETAQFCQQNAFEPSARRRCLNEYVFPVSYRCDLRALRKEIEQSEFKEDWFKILEIRSFLAASTGHDSTTTVEELRQLYREIHKLKQTYPFMGRFSGIKKLIQNMVSDATNQLAMILEADHFELRTLPNGEIELFHRPPKKKK